MEPAIYDSGANLSDEIARKLAENACSQNDAIEEFFKANPNRPMTPWEIKEELNDQILIGSVRRSLNQLTAKGVLTKHEKDKKMEWTGAENCTWEYITEAQQNMFGDEVDESGSRYGDPV